jgi:hypothetical protein
MVLVEAMDLAGKTTTLNKSLRERLERSGRATTFANKALVPANRIAHAAGGLLAAHLIDKQCRGFSG